jgi:hypothetical protein
VLTIKEVSRFFPVAHSTRARVRLTPVMRLAITTDLIELIHRLLTTTL